ncbi:MAG: LacI family DNA-binding transcriptional regulator [Phycisphaeraceae bacterium]
MASVRQIADKAGVSIATVSRVINNSPKVSEQARQRVLKVINDQNYTPRTGRISATNVAYVFTDSITLGSSYDAGILAGLSAGLEYNELDLLVLNGKSCRQGGETFSDVFRRKSVCGAIVRTTSLSQNLCRAILDSGTPTVVLGDQIEGHESVCLDVDSRGATHEAIEHLIELGHRRIGFATNVVDDKDHGDRFGGYCDALDRAGIELDPKLTFRVPANRQGGAMLARRLDALPEHPTALFVADPPTCMGLFTEARKLGIRIPDDLSVVGFDDSESRFATAPEMSAVCQDAQRLGEEAMRRLVAMMPDQAETEPTEDKNLRAWFEVHASTAPYSKP